MLPQKGISTPGFRRRVAPLDGERIQVTFVDTEGKVRYETEIRK